jgi:hypothetical protein
LIHWLAGTGAAARPLAHTAVLLTDAHLILKPDLNCRLGRQILQRFRELLAEFFLKSAIASFP